MYSPRIILNLTKRNRSLVSNELKRYQKYSTTRNVEKIRCAQGISLGCVQYSSDSPAKCWNCDYMYKSELFCSKCKVVQKFPENLNFFDIIGVRQDYDLSPEELHNKYRLLQKMLHPDKFANKSEREKEISESLSSLVNKAYSTLSNPRKRGLYMLELNNESIPEGTTSVDPDFLMEIMEKNEEVEEASDDKEKILQLFEENKEILITLTKAVSVAFRANDIETVKNILVKMEYYHSIEKRIKRIKQELGLVD